MMRVKKNDTVMVVSGKDKGKRGTVLEVDPRDSMVLVKGVAIVTRHTKAKRSGEKSSIRKQEAFIDLAKVMPVCPSCNKPSRINVKVSEDARSVRVCNRCQAAL